MAAKNDFLVFGLRLIYLNKRIDQSQRLTRTMSLPVTISPTTTGSTTMANKIIIGVPPHQVLFDNANLKTSILEITYAKVLLISRAVQIVNSDSLCSLL